MKTKELEVFKFGGASLSTSEGFLRCVEIITSLRPQNLLIVVSAMGKTTDALEKICEDYFENPQRARRRTELIKQEHLAVVAALFTSNDSLTDRIENLFLEIEWLLDDPPHADYNFLYDQIVATGELASSAIFSDLLESKGVVNKWFDARDVLVTDNKHRQANIDFTESERKTARLLAPLLASSWVVTQGFIGSTSENYSSTLGREGSDYAAAVFASLLKAKKLTLWKDVPGIMNAEPKQFLEASLLERLSYAETVELAYYGAKVVHPKTVAPLMKMGIPLHVRSYIDLDCPGTTVTASLAPASMPILITKQDQLLITLQTRDGSFIMSQVGAIFHLLSSHGLAVNAVENTALSISLAVQGVPFEELTGIFSMLGAAYQLKYNLNLTLVTIRNYAYNPSLFASVLAGRKVFMQLRTRSTLQTLID